MKSKLGLKQIDAVIPTHMHGDHFLLAPHLKKKWNAQIWGLDRMTAVCEFPHWFDYAAPIQAYEAGVNSVKFDRVFRSGEKLDWEGHQLQIDWMPGQTEFALCLQGEIDGLKIAFTGDNIFGNSADPTHTGHEAVVAHNSAILEEGYILGAEYLKRLSPDLILGGHSFVMPKPAAFIERYRRWAYEMRDAFQDLSSDPDYEYDFDPFWVRAEPYRISIPRGESAEIKVHVRNFRTTVQQHRIQVVPPKGLRAAPDELKGKINPGPKPFRAELKPEQPLPRENVGRTEKYSVTLHVHPAATPGVHIGAFDVTLDGRNYGQLFDFIVEVLE